MPAVAGPENPFVGLRPFEPQESQLFHGRKLHTQQLLRLLAAHRFLGVIGTSGSGKSSLVKAGLLPALYRGYLRGTTSRWKVAMMRPGVGPLVALAEALQAADGLALTDTTAELLQKLEQDSAALIDIAREKLEKGRESLILVVDQFEEIFGKDVAKRDAAYFIGMLLRARDELDVPVYVVLTMRSEFLGECAQYPGLAEALSEAQYLIPRLTRSQREEAIRGPLDLFGIDIEDGLVQRLLNDAGDDPDQLPALQHALRMLAAARPAVGFEGGGLTLAQYAGDTRFHLGQSLDAHAETIYTQFLTRSQRDLAHRIFRCLTKTEVGRAVRRPTELARMYGIVGAETAEAQADVRAIVRRFAAPEDSLLYSSTGLQLTDATRVDITHESLMRQWGRLNGWVKDEAESAAAFGRLVESAKLHEGGLANLWRDPDAAHAQARMVADRWNPEWARQYGPGFLEAMGFLAKSRAAIAADEAKERERAARELKAAQELTEAQARELQAANEMAEAKQRELATAKRSRNTLIGAVAALVALSALLVWALLRADAYSKLANDLRATAQVETKRAQAAEADAQAKTKENEALQATGEAKIRLEKEAAQLRSKSDDLEKQAKTDQGKLQSASDAASKQIADLQNELSAARTDASSKEIAFRKQLDDANAKLKGATDSKEYESLRGELMALQDRFRKLQAASTDSPRASKEGAIETPPGGAKPPAVSPTTKINPKDGLKYIQVPAGKFEMGCSPGDDECGIDEKPVHEVAITKGFWIGQTEVTQAAYQKVMKKNPSRSKGADRPVEQVSWDEAKKYCELAGMRLPTEAEWEFAARAGTQGARYDNLDKIAWYDKNSNSQTQPVATKYPNAWGLYDMLGNVWEWNADWYDERYYEQKVTKDPKGPSGSPNKLRVLRGGSWNSNPRNARASIRNGNVPSVQYIYIGFRCAGE